MAKTTVNKKWLGVILLVVAILTVVSTFIYMQPTKGKVPKGYIRVKSFVYYRKGELVCAAILPNCGVCDEEDVGGVIINEQCYVPKNSPFAGL